MSPPNSQKVLVVGGAGYIGAHVCERLAREGYAPVTLDNLQSGREDFVHWGPLVEVDLRDRDATFKALARHPDASAVVHLASSIEVGLGEREPSRFWTNNLVGALNLLDAMREVELDRLIFSSTCATYGSSAVLPLTESLPQEPFSTYGQTKLATEHLIRGFASAHGLRFVTLRYFNAAGASTTAPIGEAHDPETHLIPIALEAAAGRRGPLTLFGTDYPTPDGTCLRDYIHVADIAGAHIKALEAFGRGLDRAEVNIGTGTPSSNREILEAVERVTGLPVPHTEGPRRPGDVPALWADATLAREVLNWEPEHSDLDNIIASAWDWHRSQWRE